MNIDKSNALDISTVYANRIAIPANHVNQFNRRRKSSLSVIEKIGLEAVLCAFVKGYEIAKFGNWFTDLRDYTQWNEDNIGIVDGYLNTYVFGGCAIDCIWLTDNCKIVLECYKLESDIDVPTNWYEVGKPISFVLPISPWWC